MGMHITFKLGHLRGLVVMVLHFCGEETEPVVDTEVREDTTVSPLGLQVVQVSALVISGAALLCPQCWTAGDARYAFD